MLENANLSIVSISHLCAFPPFLSSYALKDCFKINDQQHNRIFDTRKRLKKETSINEKYL